MSSFEDLRVYQIARELNLVIEELVKKLPFDEKYKLKDQILRSSRSIVANIAEGHGKRVFRGDFVRHLRYALGSSDETQVHLKQIIILRRVDPRRILDLIKCYKNLSVRIVNFINIIQKTSHSQTIR